MLNMPFENQDNHFTALYDGSVVTYSSSLLNKALIIDDDPDTVSLLKIILGNAGMETVGVYSGYEALEIFADTNPSVILLDIMMPEMDGWETYQNLRRITQVPIIGVSALTHKDAVVASLHIGFDDYLTKPIFPPELIARIEAVLRRAGTNEYPQVRLFPEIGLTIDFNSGEVIYHDRLIQLTRREFAMLSVLANNAPKVVRYDKIAAMIWGEDTQQVRNRLKYLAYLLRRKIEDDPGSPQIILNREGLGYYLNSSLQ
jgi:DNA-binding response OmpR family regulator